MVTRSSGFTLVGLVVALNVLAVLAMMATPSPPPSQASSNELAALATLRRLVGGQDHFKNALCIDEDMDLLGEYGSIGELAGICLLMRHFVGVQWPLSPPVLPAAFQTVDLNGYATSSGYHYAIFLPDASVHSVGLKDVAGGGPHGAVDPNHCETLWCAYAWPVTLGLTGNRAFFVNQSGVLMETSMNACQYNGAAAAPAYSAAFSAAGMNQPLAGPPVIGVDGNDWIPAR